MDVREIFREAVREKVSDVFIIAGREISFRKDEVIKVYGDTKLSPEDTHELVRQIYDLNPHHSIENLTDDGEDDFSFSIPELSRFRVNTYMQRGTYSAVVRVITFELPKAEELGIPDAMIRMGDYTKGMVLVTGPAGSGKSTSLACIIDHINRNRSAHIITLEDPIEYLHRHNRSIVSQREIGLDTPSYVSALRAALRQSPDVILLGEMRDYETISVAMTAAETGHLLFSTLHTTGASNTINRIIDVFPAAQQRQIAVQLSTVLNAVVSQQLLPAVGGGIVAAFEIMTVTPAIRNMIRDNKVYQIDGVIYSSSAEDMISMDSSLLQLYQNGRITKDTALSHATNPEMLAKRIR